MHFHGDKLRLYARQIELFHHQWARLSGMQRAALKEWACRQWRPLRTPLAAELERAALAVERAVGFSTRRHAKRSEFDAEGEGTISIEWRLTKNKEPKRWRVRPHPDPLRAPPAVTHGWLCIYCSGERDQSGKRCEPSAPFCSYGCEESYRLRVSSCTELRLACFERDKGVCQSCGLDCHQLVMRLKPLSAARRRQVLDDEFGAAHGEPVGDGPKGWSNRLSKVRYDGIVKRCQAGDVWQADHSKAVMAGGGEVTSATMLQTLCSPCHVVKTRVDRRSGGAARSI